MLQKIDWGLLHSEGYAFIEEVLWHLHRSGARMSEVPIVFQDRLAGAIEDQCAAKPGMPEKTLIRLFHATNLPLTYPSRIDQNDCRGCTGTVSRSFSSLGHRYRKETYASNNNSPQAHLILEFYSSILHKARYTRG